MAVAISNQDRNSKYFVNFKFFRSRGVFIFETNSESPYAMGNMSDGKFLRENYNPFYDDFDDDEEMAINII